MKRLVGTSVALAVLFAAPEALAQPAGGEDHSPFDQVRPIAFTRLVAKLDRGVPWASLAGGLLCIHQGSLSWKSGRLDVKTDELDDVFRDQVEKAGYKVEGDPNNLFEHQTTTSEYAVAGTIKSASGFFCLPYSGLGNWENVKGHATLNVEWQVYSYIEKRVIGKINTSGYFDLNKSQVGGFQTIIDGAFAQSVNQLVASQAFKEAASGPVMESGELVRPNSQTLLAYSPPTATLSTIPDAVSDVVVIFAGETQGSGFLISRDGLFLTNAHVVGDAHFVKIHWSDGEEGIGEVVRTSKGRDVALVKSDPRGRQPLSIARVASRPGDPVYAIGAPLDIRFESTVTKGVYSAFRNYNGYAFIQSDVTINPGNSGGPLLNERAAIIGLTVSGMRIGSVVPTGLNLFIPIDDALQFLALSPTGAAPPVTQVAARPDSVAPSSVAPITSPASIPRAVQNPQPAECGKGGFNTPYDSSAFHRIC